MNNMMGWARDLFPINRSITGAGVRETLDYLSKILPDLKTSVYKTGQKVFDWEIPSEWSIKEAWIEHIETGKRFANFSDNNLHVVGYSEPVDLVLDKSELVKNIHTEPNQKDVIPYVTSYYRRSWGFCMTEIEKNNLPSGNYRAYINSKLFDGKLNLGEVHIKGEIDSEIVFSSYICHPSMANNELSGPLVLAALCSNLKNKMKKTKYSYRFLFLPETIGAIAYLSTNIKSLKKNVICGFVISCVGDEKAYSHIQSRYGDNLADKALNAALMDKKNARTYSFLHRGSDERQFCAPGIDLPFAGFCRSKYNEYPEYHTSADDLSLITNKGLKESLELLEDIIKAFEIGLSPKVKILGEPQLGKRNLYPNLSKKNNYSGIRTRMDFLAYCDGSNTIFDICKIAKIPLSRAIDEAELLLSKNIIGFDGLLK